jgi:hypothetical protein
LFEILPLPPYTTPRTPYLQAQQRPNEDLAPFPAFITTDLPSPSNFCGFPYWQLQLTQWFINREERDTSSNTARLPKRFYNPHHANDAAMVLAQRCRGEGEIVMLVKARELGEHCYLKEEFLISRWAHNGTTTLNSVDLLQETQRFLKRETQGKVTGMVHIVQSHDNEECGKRWRSGSLGSFSGSLRSRRVSVRSCSMSIGM